MKNYWVYIVTNKPKGVLYIGLTNNLFERIWQHKTKTVDGFTSKYNLYLLVYAEACDFPDSAIEREKQLKRWHRQWKINLIESVNPEWKDLYDTVI